MPALPAIARSLVLVLSLVTGLIGCDEDRNPTTAPTTGDIEFTRADGRPISFAADTYICFGPWQ